MNEQRVGFARFEAIPHCQFDVPAPWHCEGVVDCSKPSVYIAKWADGSTMYLCEEHAEFIEEKELEWAEEIIDAKWHGI